MDNRPDSAEKLLADVWRENDCGDGACKERRLVAAIHVLKGLGTKSHIHYAEILEKELAAAL